MMHWYFVVLKLDHGAYRTKYFLSHYLHIRVDASKGRWLNEKAVLSEPLASAMHRCAIVFAGLDIAHHTL